MYTSKSLVYVVSWVLPQFPKRWLWGRPYVCADWNRIEAFADIVNRAGYASPVRTPRGRDIMAACGQLKSESVKQTAAVRKMAELEAKKLQRPVV